MATSLVLGRFQPPHNGHAWLLAQALERSDDLVVAIGSADKGMTMRDPFTAGERYAMLRLVTDPRRTCLVTVPDLGRYPLWVRHVETYCPPFDLVVTGSHVTRMLFEEAGYDVVTVEDRDRDHLQGAVVRRLMAEGGDWTRHVPATVADRLRSLGGEERLRLLAREAGAEHG